MKRTLALDYGRRRIGVAVTDPDGTIAQPLETVTVSRVRSAIARIASLARTYDVGRIVVGLPVHMDGREGPEATEARRFGERVRVATRVPVEYLDERWTSREAERTLRSAGTRGRNRRGARDRIAATLLLETFLSRENP